ncbi:lysozyme family protein [Acutalibacter sp. LFL-21]|uniref:lysozyme family protein n=1 Tax=Acutalibacter sp. LFL-21 TaxID=2983399 RepID=UPI0021D684F3|nr:lysozyme family protein [Acutalibacter sp. LFL-21]MCU7653332.1 lysozyme family protein [Acutalibacter sp. LFL-21]
MAKEHITHPEDTNEKKQQAGRNSDTTKENASTAQETPEQARAKMGEKKTPSLAEKAEEAGKKNEGLFKGKVKKRYKKPARRKERRFVHRAAGNYARGKARKADKAPPHKSPEVNKDESPILKQAPLLSKEVTKDGFNTAKRLVQEGKSLAGEEPQAEGSGESPEQYAIDQMGGKAKKIGRIALTEGKQAVKKALEQKGKKTEAVPPQSQKKDTEKDSNKAEETDQGTDSGKKKKVEEPQKKDKEKPAESEKGKQEDPSKPQMADPDEEAPNVYNEEVQTNQEELSSPNIIKEHGIKNKRTSGTTDTGSGSPRIAVPTRPNRPSAPSNSDSGNGLHILNETHSETLSSGIASARSDLRSLEREEDGMNKVVASGNVYQNGIAQGENEIQTAGTSVHDQAARQDLYPEPVKNAYDYYPSVNPVQEERLQVELNPDHTEAEPLTTVESGRPYQPSYREGRYESPVPKETTSRTMGHPDKQQPGYQAQSSAISTHPTAGAPAPFSTKMPSPKQESRAANSTSSKGASAGDKLKKGVNAREVNSSGLNISGKVTLNTWQRDVMVNQLHNQAPALVTSGAQSGTAVQAVVNYGQTAMVQMGQGAATAASGAATAGVGIAVQAGVKVGEKVIEQIKQAIQNAVTSARSSAKTWGAGTALLLFPLMLAFAWALSSSVSNGSASNVNLSDAVIALMPQINEACQEHGIPEYAPLVAAVVMQESGGNVELVHGDVMQCAEGMGYPVGTPISVEESLDFGVELLADLLTQAGSTGPTDIVHISLALQSYNYGGGYLTWAVNKYGGYSKENALEYSQQQAAAMGWSGYGDPEYVDHVLRYYQVNAGGMGDRSAIANGLFAYPFPGHTWTTYEGHEGIDISFEGIEGQPVYAAASGTVTYVQTGYGNLQGSENLDSYGNCVFINHGGGWESRYAHMSSVVVTSGTYVQEGQLLGYVGNTGNSYGAHLHLAIYYNSSPSSGGVIYAEQAWPQLKE